MPEGSYLYCDVSLPVPLDQPFTYSLPDTLRHRVRPGSRILAPFGTRKLTGVILRCHDDRPEVATRDALRLIDSEPVLDAELLALGRWIAAYYCAPLGEVLRGMLPLASEIRQGKVWSLTDSGRDASRQLLLDSSPDDPAAQILRMLEKRPLSAAYLARSLPLADKIVRSLERKGFIAAEQVQTERDPLRAPSVRLRVELAPGAPERKLNKPERELRAFLELHPGSHNLKDLETTVKNSSAAARSLARKGLVLLRPEPMAAAAGPVRVPHRLNPAQQAAFEQIRSAIQVHRFQTFLLHGVTGSGKTEVYLNSIDAVLAEGRSALLLVPEIALTPAMAGQFFSRFGDRVAILHSAFTDVERSEQWRRIRRGAASVVVGTRSGVFAPVRNLGLIVVDEEHDGSYKQEETPRYNGRDVAIVRAQAAGACVVLGSATPSLESRYNAERGKYTLLELPGRIEARPHAHGGTGGHAAGVSRDPQTVHLLAQTAGRSRPAPRKRRADHRPAEPPRLFELRGLPRLRRARAVHQLFAHPHLSQARPPPALPLLRTMPKRCRASAPSAPASTSTSSASGRKTWKRSCTRPSPPRASPASTATQSPASGSTRPSCRTFAKATSTSWWAPR